MIVPSTLFWFGNGFRLRRYQKNQFSCKTMYFIYRITIRCHKIIFGTFARFKNAHGCRSPVCFENELEFCIATSCMRTAVKHAENILINFLQRNYGRFNSTQDFSQTSRILAHFSTCLAMPHKFVDRPIDPPPFTNSEAKHGARRERLSPYISATARKAYNILYDHYS